MRDLGIALIFAMTIVSLFVIISQGMASNYSRIDLVNPSFAQHYDKLNDLTGTINKASNATTSPSGISLLGQFDVVFNSFFSVIGITLDSYNILVGGISNIISDYTFLDPTVIYILLTSLLAALLVYIIFSIISATTRGRV